MESLTHTLTHTHTHTGRHTRCPYIQGQQGYGLVRQHNAVSGQWEFRESESTHGGGACGIRHLASPVVMYVSEHYGNAVHAVRTQCEVLDVGKYLHPSYLSAVKNCSCALGFL